MSFLCDECGEFFDSEGSLKAHVLRKHKKQLETTEIEGYEGLDEAAQVYLEALEKEVKYWEKRAKLESRLRKALNVVHEPTLEQRVSILEQNITNIFHRLQKIEKQLMDYVDEKMHVQILEKLLKYLGPSET